MVYVFDSKKTEGAGAMRGLLGGKGANLAEMNSIGLPVPPGFTITTQTCAAYQRAGGTLPAGLMDAVHAGIKRLERDRSRVFGGDKKPLLVSIRSGAAVSMPGMMDTILNCGLSDVSVEALAKETGNRRFAFDAYRRLINMFGDVVMGVDHHHFEAEFDRIKKKLKVTEDTAVSAEGLEELCDAYKAVYRKHVGSPFPQDPYAQLEAGIRAVFESWNSERANTYRRINRITDLEGTAVNVQSMVFGNMGEDCATGVAFTRDPSTGTNEFYGEFLVNAQGEDVVAGIRTPRPIDEMNQWNAGVYKELLAVRTQLETHYRDMQDIEFTIEQGRLYILQTRHGKRTGASAVKIACDMVREKLLTETEAILSLPAADLTQLLVPSFDAKSKKGATVLAKGLPASPGAAVGKLAFTADEAVERANNGEKVILVRKETSPEDVEGMHSAVGILTSTGGMTSHAAVVARGWGKCCIVGASSLQIDAAKRQVKIAGKTLNHNTVISIDGSTGEVLAGELSAPPPKMTADFERVMTWADKHRTLKVRANADTPADATRARDFGAEGIGLCRTEHMFFEGDRIIAMRRMIMAETREQREAALAELLPYQRKDFIGLFKAMQGLPVTIRLLDPPLHEFLPNDDDAQREMAQVLGVSVAAVRQRVSDLHEANPMLGHRGCRLSVSHPEILVMQVRAIVEAAIECTLKKIKAIPEIMIPLVSLAAELEMLRRTVEQTIEQVKKDRGFKGALPILIGTMIETPRAAMRADAIAENADFFSFGTNDMTQMAYGFSRDDISSFLPTYLRRGLLNVDPFETLDANGVGALVRTAVERGRATRKAIKLGVCGEHGGDPDSICFFHAVGLEYVSCSPFRVPVARLAAAQAALRAGGSKAKRTSPSKPSRNGKKR
ncbi:MAG: pyruvate, phosphate dikinase [Phycisphaerales bacterium]|nr:pyruvate, phosphate dikinase [Phycisphaerales bacterium]